MRVLRDDTNVGNGTLAFEIWHEASRCVALRMLGRLLRHPIQHRPAQLRHDTRGGVERARCAARVLLRPGGVGKVARLRLAGHSRLLSRRLGYGAAVSQRPADRLEEGLAPPAPVPVLRSAARRPWFLFPSSIFHRSPPAPPAPSRCATRSTSPASQTSSASPATGWPSITTCLRSQAPRPRS